MTLNEKLNLISDLESANFNSKTIDTIVESIEHPENLHGPYNTVEDLWKALEGDTDEDN